MKIGILGSGGVGQALGKGFADLGHDVKIGTRDPGQDKIKTWVGKTGPKASAGTYAEAASFGELLVLASPWSGTENAIKLSEKKNFSDKVVIDVTNPLDFSSGSSPKLALGHTDSGGEQVQRWIPEAHVVKAFNIIGAPFMVNPQFDGGPPDMFICGNDEKAKQKVTDILTAFKWSTVDIGGIEGSRFLEPMAMAWVLYGFKTNTWSHAFKLLRK
ncbi:MAG: NAD(P)-binding domain-containing protein [Ignavibacteriales bacterium]|nr:NAD(P)-binding domain-containing protein [Ignavibacteriales bacterium]